MLGGRGGRSGVNGRENDVTEKGGLKRPGAEERLLPSLSLGFYDVAAVASIRVGGFKRRELRREM